MESCDKCCGPDSLSVPFHVHWPVVIFLAVVLAVPWLLGAGIGRAINDIRNNWKIQPYEALLMILAIPVFLIGALCFIPFCIIGFFVDGKARREMIGKTKANLSDIWRDRFSLWNQK